MQKIDWDIYQLLDDCRLMGEISANRLSTMVSTSSSMPDKVCFIISISDLYFSVSCRTYSNSSIFLSTLSDSLSIRPSCGSMWSALSCLMIPSCLVEICLTSDSNLLWWACSSFVRDYILVVSSTDFSSLRRLWVWVIFESSSRMGLVAGCSSCSASSRITRIFYMG